MNTFRLTTLSLFLGVAILALCVNDAFSEEYGFDISEVEKKPYHLGGYIEFRPVLFGLGEYNGKFQVDGSLEKGIGRLFVRINSDYRNSYQGDSFLTTFYEGYLSLKPSSSFSLAMGKRSLRWGKGYAWNPAAFLDRPKDPEDPELSQEGFIVASADYIKSFSGPLQTLSLTPVLLPVYDGLNDDFGKLHHINVGGKLYLLLYDTDLDFIFLTGGSKTTSWGFDVSRNITTNFEMHGEFAFLSGFQKRYLAPDGRILAREFDATSWLAGIRYLTEQDTTCIVEYYRNGVGFSGGETRDYFAFVNGAYDTYRATGDDDQLRKAAGLAEVGYGRMNPMRDYLYARVSQKEPFDILYLTPAITAIVNLNDGSFSLSPELFYTGITNWELRLKGTLLEEGSLTEFGEKQNDFRVELRVRYYF